MDQPQRHRPGSSASVSVQESVSPAPAAAAAEASGRRQVTVYTDGAAQPNPGRGGYGVVLLYQGHRRELSGGCCRTTNNRMEILAAICGLEALREPCQVTLYSDSRYLVNAMAKGWVRRWRRNGWMRTADAEAVNPDLWERLYQLCQTHDVRFTWVRGHSTDRENQRCDALASAARARPDLPPDPGYEGRS